MSALWTGEEMVAAMGGRPLGAMPIEVSGISIDSRTLSRGDAFFAIKGDTFDGHDFATAATVAGASVLVVAEGRLPALGRVRTPMIVVDDVLAALGRLGAAARARTGGRIVAVTGSAGKTTTKETLRHILSGQGKVHASDKSFNNHWGVPLTLARMPADTDFGVFEIGMNHPGEIRPLVKLVRPHVALVTLIAAAHLGHFRNLEEIARAKAEIFEGVDAGGIALVNRDDRHCRLLATLAKQAGIKRIEGFGAHAKARYRLEAYEPTEAGSRVSLRIGDRALEAEIGAPGRHMALNALVSLAVCDLIGADVEAAAARLSGLVPEGGRGRQHRLEVKGGIVTLIDESYNANPASMAAALEVLATAPIGEGGRRIAVLGDMLELGEHSARLHAELASAFEGRGVDLAFLGGDAMAALAAKPPAGVACEYRATLAELKPLVLAALAPGDAVMVKSSKGVGFSRIVDAMLEEFPAAAMRKSA